jgi:hypothetical protein
MVDIGEAVTYPTESDDFAVTILIGGGLTILSFLIVPAILVTGYIVSVLRARYDGQPAPPSFGDWETLLMDGLKASAIGLVYMLVPLLVGGVLVGGSVLALATESRSGAALGFGGIFGSFLLMGVLSVIFGYIAAAGVLNFAHRGSIADGFDFERIGTLATSGDYVVAWAAVIGISIVISVINGMLNFVPILGSIAGIFVAFYGQMVMARLLADGYIDTFDLETSPTPSTPTRAEQM